MSSDIPTSRRKFLVTSLLALPALGAMVHTLSAAEAAAMAAPDLHSYQPEFSPQTNGPSFSRHVTG